MQGAGWDLQLTFLLAACWLASRRCRELLVAPCAPLLVDFLHKDLKSGSCASARPWGCSLPAWHNTFTASNWHRLAALSSS